MKWKKIRAKVLRRDEYLCRECKRYGKTTLANTVHHIKPASKYPELRFNINTYIAVAQLAIILSMTETLTDLQIRDCN